jgi:hypothetical protein
MGVEQSTVHTGIESQAVGSAAPRRLRRNTRTWLAWSLIGLGAVLLAMEVALTLLNGDNPVDLATYLLTFNAFLPIGALIAARRSENPIGWMFCGVGLTTDLAIALQEYARFALLTQAGSLPGGEIAGVLGMLIQPTSWLLGFLGFMLFPTGRAVTRFLGALTWAYLALFVVSIFVDTLAAPTIGSFENLPNPIHVEGLAELSELADTVAGFLSVILVAATAIMRFRRSGPVERLQLKWVTYSIVVVVLLGLLVGAAQESLQRNFGVPQAVFDNISVLSILWLVVSVAIAVLRYRLYDIDLIINRTLVYVPLTGILAGVYAASISILQGVFVAITGQTSDAAIIISTLLLTAIFTPVQNFLQALVDRRWKEPPGSIKQLEAFGKQVQESFSPVEPGKVMRRLIVEATLAVHARSGAAYLLRDGQMQLVHTYGDWKDGGNDSLDVYLEDAGERVGLIRLGDRSGAGDYSKKERKALQETADAVASAISPGAIA